MTPASTHLMSYSVFFRTRTHFVDDFFFRGFQSSIRCYHRGCYDYFGSDAILKGCFVLVEYTYCDDLQRAIGLFLRHYHSFFLFDSLIIICMF